jgi:hypothetical protein
LTITRTEKRIGLVTALFSLSLGSAACARNYGEQELRTLVIRSARDSISLQRTPEMTSFAVDLIIRNGGSRPIIVGGCGPEAQRQISGQWQTVWRPVCVSEHASLVAPGDSLTGSLTIAGFTKPGIEPPLDPRMTAGTYRLRFGVSDPSSSGTQPVSGTRVPTPYPIPGKRLGFVASKPFTVYGP